MSNSKIYVSMLCFHVGSERAVCLFPIHCEEPELASVSGSPLRPAAAWRSSMSLTETLLRLIQGEIMGPATPNPLKSHSMAASWQGGPVEHRVDEVANGAAILPIRPTHMLIIYGAYRTCCSGA